MSVQIKLFASLAEAHGWREQTLAFSTDLTVGTAWARATGEPALPAHTLCALNMAYCTPDTPITDGDEVAFFPPVTGGEHAG